MDSGIAIAALAKRKRRFRIERKRPFAPSGTAHLHLYTAGVRRSEWKQKIRFTFRPDFAIITPAEYAPVAQLDRVTDSDSVGQRFESARAYHKKPLEALCFKGLFIFYIFGMESYMCSRIIINIAVSAYIARDPSGFFKMIQVRKTFTHSKPFLAQWKVIPIL